LETVGGLSDVRDVAILSDCRNCLMVITSKSGFLWMGCLFHLGNPGKKKLSKIDALKMMSNCCPASVFKPSRLPMNIAMENPPFEHVFPSGKGWIFSQPC